MALKHIAPPQNEAINREFRYAPAVASNGLLFVSGQTGFEADDSISADPETQIRRAFLNLENVLKAGGASWQRLVEITTYNVHMAEHLPLVAKVKNEFIHEPYPAWTALGVAALALPDLIFEIHAVADVS